MPRKARIDYPDGVYHLIVRGIERKRIFRDDQDRNGFLDRLGLLFLESKTSCFAWALLPNHVHLLIESRQRKRRPLSIQVSHPKSHKKGRLTTSEIVVWEAMGDRPQMVDVEIGNLGTLPNKKTVSNQCKNLTNRRSMKNCWTC